MPDDAGGSANIKKQNRILKLFGHNMLEKVTQQDIMLMLLAVKEKGVIEASTYSMIKNIFEFDDYCINVLAQTSKKRNGF